MFFCLFMLKKNDLITFKGERVMVILYKWPHSEIVIFNILDKNYMLHEACDLYIFESASTKPHQN